MIQSTAVRTNAMETMEDTRKDKVEENTDLSVSPLQSDSMPLWTRPGFLIRRLNQIHYAIFLEECAGFDLTPVQYGLLTALSEHPGSDQASLAREVGLDRTNAADILRRLERRGLVIRRSSDTDKRVKLSYLTEEGERVRRDMFGAMRNAQVKLLEPLSPQAQNDFLLMMMRIVSAKNHLGRTIFRPS